MHSISIIFLNLVLFIPHLSVAEGKEWDFKDYKIVRERFGPDDPWSVDRCPKRKHEKVEYVEFKEDCTKFIRCWWYKSKGKVLDTIKVQLLTCPDCHNSATECTLNNKQIYVPLKKHCFNPELVEPSDSKCGTRGK